MYKISYILTDTKDVLVASNSLPNYANKETNPYDRKITFTGRLVSTENYTFNHYN